MLQRTKLKQMITFVHVVTLNFIISETLVIASEIMDGAIVDD